MEITEDRILGGKLLIRQPKIGYRVNVDTILLAATLAPHRLVAGARVVEPGCGVGAALLAVAIQAQAEPHHAETRFIGIERDPAMAALARENVAANALSDRVEIIEGDALAPAIEGRFDHVIFNPPYDYPGDGRAPLEARRAAYLLDRPLGDWIKVWSNRMTGGATLTLIQRAHRLAEILAAMEGRLGGVEVSPIRPYKTQPARRVLVTARKGSKAPLALLAEMSLHPPDGAKDKHTPRVEALLRGDWGLNVC